MPSFAPSFDLELKRIQLELGATILYVTHDQVEAMTMASRIGVIKDGQLLQLGTPREIYENPANSYVACGSERRRSISFRQRTIPESRRRPGPRPSHPYRDS